MSIVENLQSILQARYGKDVRQAIHDGIEEGYNIAVQAEGRATTAQNSAQASANAAALSSQQANAAKTQAEQFKNQAFSGTPEGYEALVDKVNSIYKETASHYAIVGSSEGSALAHTIYGMSKQDGTPTPDSPVEIQSAIANYKCEGKNLIVFPYYSNSKTSNGVTFTVLDDGTIIANGTSTGTGSIFELTAYVQYPPNPNYPANRLIKSNGRKFRLSGCPSGGGNDTYYLQCAGGNTINPQWNGGNTDTGNGGVFRANIDDYYFYIYNLRIVVASGYTANNLVFKPMLTVWGDSEEYQPDQTYEPYKATKVTTDLTLRAIEVTSSDDYNLVKDGKYYIADTVDWNEDTGFYHLTKRIGHIELDGNEVSNAWTLSGENMYFCNLGAINAEQMLFKYRTKILSDRFKAMQGLGNGTFGQIRGGGTEISTSICFGDSEKNFATLAEFLTWLHDHPTTVDYILATPSAIPIPPPLVEALLSLKTYDGATSITGESDIEPIMELEYSKDRNTALSLTGHNLAHKNALKLEELNNALLEVMAETEA